MSIESKVFEKLFTTDKVELESQKVELESKKYEFVLLDTALKVANTLEKMAEMIKQDGDKQNEYREKVSRQGETIMNQWQNGQDIIQQISIGAKQLGIPLNSIKEVKRITDIQDLILTYRKRYSF
jgi:flagellar biosynthesis chaperone FliJ